MNSIWKIIQIIRRWWSDVNGKHRKQEMFVKPECCLCFIRFYDCRQNSINIIHFAFNNFHLFLVISAFDGLALVYVYINLLAIILHILLIKHHNYTACKLCTCWTMNIAGHCVIAYKMHHMRMNRTFFCPILYGRRTNDSRRPSQVSKNYCVCRHWNQF